MKKTLFKVGCVAAEVFAWMECPAVAAQEHHWRPFLPDTFNTSP